VIFAVLEWQLLQLRETDSSFVFNNWLNMLWNRGGVKWCNCYIECQHISKLQTSKNSPVFWPTLYIFGCDTVFDVIVIRFTSATSGTSMTSTWHKACLAVSR